ncbi:hypothetical protein bcgnr5380_57820 [Bacillus cereus]
MTTLPAYHRLVFFYAALAGAFAALPITTAERSRYVGELPCDTFRR